MTLPSKLTRWAAALAVAAAGAVLPAPLAAHAAPTPSPSTTTSAPDAGVESDHVLLGVLPDTQFHARYATEETGNPYRAAYGSEPYDAQTRWLADSAVEYGTEFVIHLGDVVDQANHPQQWDVADRAMRNLEDAKLPYSILAGNHDVGSDFAEYLGAFPASRAGAEPTFGGSDPTGLHSWHEIDHDGQKILVLSLSWGASDEALAWAADVLDAHPQQPTIIASHQLINISPDGTAPEATDFGEHVWDALIRDHDQVFLTLNGHHHGAMTWERTNDFGHPVHQVLIDHQMAYMGGNGILSMLDLDLGGDQISLTTLSPWVAEKPKQTLQPLDEALLDAPQESFTIPFDFGARFPGLKLSSRTRTSPTLAIRDWITSAVTVPPARALTAPRDAEDYPQVDGTVAHWRPTGQEGVAKVGAVVPDIAGGNDFTRAELNIAGAEGAEEGDVTFSADHAQYSSAPGSVCFANADKSTRRASWFATAADAPINTVDLSGGFTMETFVKIDPSYSASSNAWMTWLGRDGQRQHIAGYTGSEGEEPPMAWAFSNLNEVQFAFVDGTPQRVENSLWSGEIVDYTEWMHLAVVSDPATGIATLYVNGVPMLRNASGVDGLAHDAGLPWLLGAGTYAGVRDSGFVGCIGETRVVKGVLGPDQWLTARAEKAEPGSDGTPGTDGKPGTDGEPGAEGSPGNPGTDGNPGADGSPGTDGRPGADGKPGAHGKPGADGEPAAPAGGAQSGDTAPSAAQNGAAEHSPQAEHTPTANRSPRAERPSSRGVTGLARTGAELLPAAAVALALVGLGAALIRRRAEHSR